MSILGNAVGGTAPIKTLTIVDADGIEMTGVVVDSEVIFTATDNDVREGMVYASDEGVSTGTKFIPPYYTSKGIKVIKSGSEFELVLSERDAYDYTSMQCILCQYNTSLSNSVFSDKVVIEDKLYETNSTTAISTLSKNSEKKSIKLGITNESDISYIVRYFTYKEDV